MAMNRGSYQSTLTVQQLKNVPKLNSNTSLREFPLVHDSRCFPVKCSSLKRQHRCDIGVGRRNGVFCRLGLLSQSVTLAGKGEHFWVKIFNLTLDRIYVLRSQIVHVAATRGNSCLALCRQVLEALMPVILRLVWTNRS